MQLGSVTKKYMVSGFAGQFATQALAEQFAEKNVQPGHTMDIEEIDCTVVAQVSLPAVQPTVARAPAAQAETAAPASPAAGQ